VLISATRKIPALLSGSIHRWMNDSQSVIVSTVSTKNVAKEPISSVRSDFPVAGPTANAATAIASAATTAVVKGRYRQAPNRRSTAQGQTACPRWVSLWLAVHRGVGGKVQRWRRRPAGQTGGCRGVFAVHPLPTPPAYTSVIRRLRDKCCVTYRLHRSASTTAEVAESDQPAGPPGRSVAACRKDLA